MNLNKIKSFHLFILCLLISSFCPAGIFAQEHHSAENLFNLSLEEILNITVTSPSKLPRPYKESASAIYVLTSEDIRRSGATSIAEALRMVPGMNVGRVDSSRYAVSVRGFQAQIASMLLVLLDGRTIYNPVISGVYWDEQNMMLEDIDRIEVIRGPGATLWGANAVNGVINIITKHSRDTLGTLVSTAIGNEEQHITSLRHGFRSGGLSMRVYGRFVERDAFVDNKNNETGDDWENARAGFRGDWSISDKDTILFLGDWYTADIDKKGLLNLLNPEKSRTITGEAKNRGEALQTRWTHKFSKTSKMMLQGFYSRSERNDDFGTDLYVDVYDLELQHSFRAAQHHDFVWGLGYRYVRDNNNPGQFSSMNPASDNKNLFSFFIQDEISLMSDRLQLIMGSKVEHNDFTGVEIQPNIRFIWKPTEGQQFWAAVSRAVQTPSRAVEDSRSVITSLPQGSHRPAAEFIMFGKNIDSVRLISYETGYRNLITDRLALDISGFYNDYDKMLSFPVSDGRPYTDRTNGRTRIIIPFTFTQSLEGKLYGFEIAAEWQPYNNWRLITSYSHLRMSLDGANSHNLERRTPKHQCSLRSLVNLPWDLEFDTYVYFVDRVPDYDISGYIRTDVRIGWRPIKNLDISLAGQNLFDGHHPEYKGTLYAVDTDIERSIYIKVTWQFGQ